MAYKISVILRVYNEEKHLKEVLTSLFNQTYKNFEVIIVNSESTDKSMEIAEQFDVRIVNIKKSDFNYSYASNIGAEASTGDILCYLSGHSVPVKETFLEDIIQVFNNTLVGGCYGEVLALSDGSIIEKIFNYLGYVKNRNRKIELETSIHPGILSCSNACIRKRLWEIHPFREELGKGGEDVEMAFNIIKDGYYIERNSALLVRHSHGSGVFKFYREFKNWRIMYDDVLRFINENSQENGIS